VAGVQVGDEHDELPAGAVAVVPEGVPHEVRNTGDVTLRFVAVYASGEVVTRYDDEVQPDGTRKRHRPQPDRRRRTSRVGDQVAGRFSWARPSPRGCA
jgi:hypothetical protein